MKITPVMAVVLVVVDALLIIIGYAARNSATDEDDEIVADARELVRKIRALEERPVENP